MTLTDYSDEDLLKVPPGTPGLFDELARRVIVGTGGPAETLRHYVGALAQALGVDVDREQLHTDTGITEVGEAALAALAALHRSRTVVAAADAAALPAWSWVIRCDPAGDPYITGGRACYPIRAHEVSQRARDEGWDFRIFTGGSAS